MISINKRIIISAGFLVFLFTLVSCSDLGVRNQSTLEKFVDRAGKNPEKLAPGDWEKADIDFGQFVKDFDRVKDKLNREQRDKANELIGRYYALRMKGFGNELKETIDDYGKQLEGALKEISDSLE